jgi:acyl-CoA synthetase (AMP-forming)/AMP-acid ligase II
MPLNELLPKAARLYHSKEAVICRDKRLTYGDFAKRVWRLSHALKQLNLNKGDRLAILHENCHRFLEAYFSAAHLGLILVPLNIRLSGRELTVILRDSRPGVLIAQAKFHNKVSEFISETQGIQEIIWTLRGIEKLDPAGLDYEDLIKDKPETPPTAVSIHDTDIAHLYYTSGTTSKPKGVMLTHKNVITHAMGAIAELQITDQDHWVHAAPLFHLADAWATFSITWSGGRHILLPTFDPVKTLETIAVEKVTITNLIPTMLNMMVNHPEINNFNYSSLRVLLSGGAPIAPDLVRKIIDIFKCDYIQTYGMTETSPYLTLSILKQNLLNLPFKEQLRFKASAGREFITIDLKVVAETGKEVARDNKQVGEIIVKGDTVTPGYWNMPGETRAAIQNGWLKTGDLAVIDQEGYLTIVDRKKDMILSGGENVYSTEVENVLYQHGDILEAAVTGVPDKHWGEAVKAWVVLKQGREATAEEIIRFCKQRLAHYKAPKTVDFIETLPKTGSGKIFKKALRNNHWKNTGKEA